MGHPVVMGRRTWESIPDRFRPLPGRRNVVVTRNAAWHADGAERAASLDDALELLDGAPQVFVIGGAELYAAALPLADELLLTEIDVAVDGDTLFPPFDRAEFEEASREPHVSADGTPFSFVTYVRRTGEHVSLRVGTSGWSYPTWRPGFYPAAADPSGVPRPVRRALRHGRAEQHRLPAALGRAVRAAGRSRCRDSFRFAVKAPRWTLRRLDTVQERVQVLGERLGCIRLVVPTPRDDGLLELLLGSVDPAIRWALDLRDDSWDGVEARLAEVGAVRVDDWRGAGRLALPSLPRPALRRGGARPARASASARSSTRPRRARVLPPRGRADGSRVRRTPAPPRRKPHLRAVDSGRPASAYPGGRSTRARTAPEATCDAPRR